jgi:2-dehydropantoate 2-reductase
MKACVFGAGAVGGHIAARLAKAGTRVSVVARGVGLAAMRRRGLRVEAPGEVIDAEVTASDNPAELGPQDVVVVTVKAPALPSVAAMIGPLLGPETPVVFAMNGIPWWYFHAHGGPLDGQRLPQIDPGGALWQAVGPERAIGGVVYSACTAIEPGVVRVEGRSKLILGEPDGRMSSRLEEVAGCLVRGGLRCEVTERVREAIWTKLLLNLAVPPLCVLADASQPTVISEPACAEAVPRLLSEAAGIATAMGCAVEYDAASIVGSAARLAHTPSIAQDLELRRPMEIDGIYTVPLELGRLTGVATPTLDLLVGLMKVKARTAGLYD